MTRTRSPSRAQQVGAALGGLRLVEERTGNVTVATDKGQGDVEAMEIDLRDPATDGLFRLDVRPLAGRGRGRW